MNLLAENRINGEFYRPKYVIMNLKFDHQRGLYTVDLKIYSQLAHLKNIDKFGF